MVERRIRVLVGTRKGTYVVTGGRARRRWTVGPIATPGRPVYHVVADPRHVGHLYAAANSDWWGPILYRSSDWGKRWKEVATPLTPASKAREGGNEVARPVKALWHVEPGHPSEPDTLFVGADPHLLFRSDDLAGSWQPVEAINAHPDRADWSPGAGGPCTHTVLVDPRDARRMYLGMSAVGVFRTDDGGGHWRPANTKVECPFLPDKYPETGQCVHHVVLDPAQPDVSYRQDHGGIYVHRHGMEGPWDRVGRSRGGPPDDFGFAAAVAPARPGRAYFVPLDGETRTAAGATLQVWEWNDRPRKWRTLVPRGRFPGAFGVHREGLAADALDPPGLYVGTTTGQLFVSPDGGRSWLLVPYQFPGIHSVSVAG